MSSRRLISGCLGLRHLPWLKPRRHSQAIAVAGTGVVRGHLMRRDTT
jgi:hypothetical protein